VDFDFSTEQIAFKAEIIKFARQELNVDLIHKDQECIFPRDEWQKCADFGLIGLPFPQQYGGNEADIVTTMLAMEALGYGCKNSSLIFAINAQMWSVQAPMWKFGSEEQKNHYLRDLCTGKIIGAHGMSEPDSGSDAFSLKTTAEKKGKTYILNGQKTFVTNAPVADVFVVFANTDRSKGFFGITAFILEKNFPGLKVSKEIKKMGLRSAPMAEVILENCQVPEENLLGREGMGTTIFNSSMEWERSCILASNVGSMERQLESCIKYARERKQFNRSISKFQSVANKIVDMKVRLETSRLVLYKIAWLKQKDKDAVLDAALAKLYLSESWVQTCLDAIQIHGGYGYTTEYEIERDLRDAISGRIYSGTSEIQRNIIARKLGL
jgi:alkylation response protein AidB-like acyl-CoA dehydrogenase